MEALIFWSMIGVSCVISWVIMRILNQHARSMNGFVSATISGLAPTILIVSPLIVWHLVEIAQPLGPMEDSYMSPLLIVVYGMPYFIIMLALNLIVASRVRNQA